jgi:hypothetical protein
MHPLRKSVHTYTLSAQRDRQTCVCVGAKWVVLVRRGMLHMCTRELHMQKSPQQTIRSLEFVRSVGSINSAHRE